MRKLWPLIRVIWTLIIFALVVSFIAQLLYEKPRPEVLALILSNRVLPTLVLVFVGFILLTFISWLAHNRHANQQLLESEFALCVEGENLKPEHFDYEVVDPGESPSSGRPFHKAYVPRLLTKFDEFTEPSHTKSAERFLSKRLRNGATLVLLGQQTDGKTRTIFEVCKGFTNYTILRPRIARTPSNSAIQLLKGKNVIIFFDDLEQYVRKDYDPKEMIRKIRERTNSCGVIVACRDSDELKAVKSDRPEYSNQLSRFFSDIEARYRLIDLDEDGKRELWKSTRTDAPPKTFKLFKTVGSICMENGYQVMQDKFHGLPPKSQYCVWAIQLLLRGSIQPLSYKRLACVMRNIFQLTHEPAPSTLRPLRDKGFLKSDDDPIIPEVAYLRWWGPDPVITYRDNRLPQDDFDNLNKAIESCGDVEALVSLGVVHGTEGRHDKALSCFDLSTEISLQISPELNALALVNKGSSLRELNRPEDAITVWEEVVTHFGDASDPILREWVAISLFNKGLTLRELNRSEEAITAWAELITRFGDASKSALRKWVAISLFNNGVELTELNRPQEAITAYEELIICFGDDSDPALLQRVGEAFYNKGYVLKVLNRPEEEINAYEELIIRFGDASDPTLLQLVGDALYNKGVVLSELNRPQEAITAYEELITRFGDGSVPALLQRVASALINKGLVLRELNRPKEEITIYEELITRFGDTSDPALLQQVASALINKGFVLREHNRLEKAVTACEELITRFGDTSDPALLQQVGNALYNKGLALRELERPKEAFNAWEEVINRFGNASDPALLQRVGDVILNKGLVLRELERPKEALTAWEEIITRFGNASDPALLQRVASALINRGVVMTELNRTKEAITAYEEVITRFDDAFEPAFQQQVASALINKGLALTELNRPKEAINAYKEMITRFGDASAPAIREVVFRARSLRQKLEE